MACDRTFVGDSVGLTHCSVSANFFISKPFMAHSFRCVSPSADTHMCVYLKSAGCSSCGHITLKVMEAANAAQAAIC